MGVQDGVSPYSHGAPLLPQYGTSHLSSFQYADYHSTASGSSQTKRGKRKAMASGLPEHMGKPQHIVDLTQDSPPKKRKSNANILDAEPGLDVETPKKRKKKAKDEEKRLRRWRPHAPASYLEIRDRALNQRMFALDRFRDNSNSEHPTETVSLAGTTGNVYTIVVDKVPSCDCPHAKKGNQCKHIAYVLSRVLRVRSDLEYQLAFLSSELREIFERAPPLPSETAENAKDGNRKPIDGECPICCVDFEPQSGEAIVFCKAACGNNVHETCFQQWAATKQGGSVTCPFCRTPWQGDEEMIKNIARTGPRNEEGYVNVASQLGLSGRRDYSSYHSYWVRRQIRSGEISWDDDGVMVHDRF